MSRSVFDASRLATLGALSLVLGGCSTKDKDASVTARDSSAVAAPAMSAAPSGASMAGMSDSSMKGMSGSGSMGGMAMSGDPDHDFLRMMSDHHKGLTEMAHTAKKMKLPVAADASKLDTRQDAELDKMVTMLEKQYKDPYSPKIMSSNQAMIDALRGKTGTDYEKTFYQNVVQHHQEALKMIDDYLPKARKPELKAMAEKMKADQTKEIADFQQKIAKL